MEALGRVELPTNGLGNRCSIHLSYRAITNSVFVIRACSQKYHDDQLNIIKTIPDTNLCVKTSPGILFFYFAGFALRNINAFLP